jgi:hypothetical protein
MCGWSVSLSCTFFLYIELKSSFMKMKSELHFHEVLWYKMILHKLKRSSIWLVYESQLEDLFV